MTDSEKSLNLLALRCKLENEKKAAQTKIYSILSEAHKDDESCINRTYEYIGDCMSEGAYNFDFDEELKEGGCKNCIEARRIKNDIIKILNKKIIVAKTKLTKLGKKNIHLASI